MGIPSYFNHISNNYEKIFKKRKKIGEIDELYIDSNSIVYDIIKQNEEELSNIEIYKFVCKKIQNYIDIVNPSRRVFISLDGVAPLAKVNQQRERRFKSSFLKRLMNESNGFDTSCITPGTDFMTGLDVYVSEYFSKYTTIDIIVSGSNKVGEGEHKIFSYLREKKDNINSICVYGLDADLIILSLQHIYVCSKIYLFRENPDYSNILDNMYDKNELCFLDINILGNDIYNNLCSDSSSQKKQIIEDYVFMSYFLGNDFMPHFPSLNIRTHGIQTLLDTYKSLRNKRKFHFSNCSGIIWKNVLLFVKELEKLEENMLITETKTLLRYKPREKYEDTEKKINFLPSQNRDYEKYINPTKYGWRTRYYETLFGTSKKEDIKKICISYLEGLEWTHSYYREGCKNYRWYYPFKYPPLLRDLYQYIPHFQCNLVCEDYRAIHAYTLLSYVLPCSSHNILPNKIKNIIMEYNSTKKEQVYFIWAYCRYFWESHIYGLDINEIDEIEKLLEYHSLI